MSQHPNDDYILVESTAPLPTETIQVEDGGPIGHDVTDEQRAAMDECGTVLQQPWAQTRA